MFMPCWEYGKSGTEDAAAGYGALLRTMAIGECLDTIINNTPEKCPDAFAALLKHNVRLGDGGFVLILFVTEQAYSSEFCGSRRLPDAASGISEVLYGRFWHYLFSSAGKLFALLCFPWAQEESFNAAAALDAVEEACSAILASPDAAGVIRRIQVSGVHWGQSSIFYAANSLRHAYEFFEFITNPPAVTLIRGHEQILVAFSKNLEVYHKLSYEVAARIKEEDFSAGETAPLIVHKIIQLCAPSMESVHYHIQMFALTFTDVLVKNNIVEAEYIDSRNIVQELMTGITEEEFAGIAARVLDGLREQYLFNTRFSMSDKIKQIEAYIDVNICEYALSVNMISDQFRMNRSQLSILYKKYYGISLSDSIQAKRVGQAKRLIEAHPGWSMSRIASASGYVSLSTMYRAFKKSTGVSPGLFRRSDHPEQ